MIREVLRDDHLWYRVSEAAWDHPLDATFAQARGGRWNPANSWRTLHLNEDRVAARLNVERFIAGWPYEPEDLTDDAGPDLVVTRLPRDQTVADVHTPEGLTAAGLPSTYPLDAAGVVVPHAACQAVGAAAKEADLRGVHCRSSRSAPNDGRELAWFPATIRSRPRLVERLPFAAWFWG